MVLAHLHLNMALMRAVLYRRLNVVRVDLEETPKYIVFKILKSLLRGALSFFHSVATWRATQMKNASALIVTDDFTIEPRPRQVPIPFDRRGRDLEESGCVFNGQSAEIAQFDDSALLRVAGVQIFKRVI